MKTIRQMAAAGLAALVLLLVACSPEDGRRPGERGADVGNRPDEPADVELHGTSNPAHDVPDRAPVVGKAADSKK